MYFVCRMMPQIISCGMHSPAAHPALVKALSAYSKFSNGSEDQLLDEVSTTSKVSGRSLLYCLCANVDSSMAQTNSWTR